MNESILMIAGEASADMHGAKLVEALSSQYPNVQLFGIGGHAMRDAGFEAVIQAEQIAVAGLTEVLLALPRLWRYMQQLVTLAKTKRPKVAILIDLPDFNLRLAKKLKALGIPVLYYISPQVWAWRAKRVEQIRQYVDKMLVILPFEKPFYEQHHVPVEFVGHPLVDLLPRNPSKWLARQHLGIAENQLTIALLPGSRHKEVTRHLPVMLESIARLQKQKPELQALIPVASTVAKNLIEDIVTQSQVRAKVIEGKATEVLSAADAAVVCSGTATLQAALLARPMVVIYKVSWLTYQILKRLVKVAHIGMVNLIAQKRLCPELIQNDVTAENIEQQLQPLLQNSQHYTTELLHLRDHLSGGNVALRVAQIAGTYLSKEVSQ